jgi:hypothetical protein
VKQEVKGLHLQYNVHAMQVNVCETGGDGVVSVVQRVCNAGQCTCVSQEVTGCVGQALQDSSCALFDTSHGRLDRMDMHARPAADPSSAKVGHKSSLDLRPTLALQGSAAGLECTFR